MKQKMINEMFKRIHKGPAMANMTIFSKKHFSKAGEYNDKIFKDGKQPNQIEVFHWYKHSYNVLFHDYENNKHDIIAEDFTSWLDAFKWVADYVLANDF